MITRQIQQEVPHAFGSNVTQGIYGYSPPPMGGCPPPQMLGCPPPPPPIGMNMRVGQALGSSCFKRSSFDFSLRSSDASDEEELGWRGSDENDPSSNEGTLTKLIHLQTA